MLFHSLWSTPYNIGPFVGQMSASRQLHCPLVTAFHIPPAGTETGLSWLVMKFENCLCVDLTLPGFIVVTYEIFNTDKVIACLSLKVKMRTVGCSGSDNRLLFVDKALRGI